MGWIKLDIGILCIFEFTNYVEWVFITEFLGNAIKVSVNVHEELEEDLI